MNTCWAEGHCGQIWGTSQCMSGFILIFDKKSPKLKEWFWTTGKTKRITAITAFCFSCIISPLITPLVYPDPGSGTTGPTETEPYGLGLPYGHTTVFTWICSHWLSVPAIFDGTACSASVALNFLYFLNSLTVKLYLKYYADYTPERQEQCRAVSWIIQYYVAKKTSKIQTVESISVSQTPQGLVFPRSRCSSWPFHFKTGLPPLDLVMWGNMKGLYPCEQEVQRGCLSLLHLKLLT